MSPNFQNHASLTALRTLKTVLLAVLLLACTAASAHASWWNSDWTLRRKITLDTTAAGAAISDPIGTTPVLIRLSDANLHFSSAQPDGSDLRFVAEDDKTLLSYHLEKFDPLLNEAFVWVKVPDLKPAAKTVLWLYYGNNGGKVAKGEDAKATYDEHTVLVYHFNEHGAPANDFTMGGNNAQTIGQSAEGSMIGSGLRVDGKSTVTIPASASMFWTEGSSVTWSAWVKFGPPVPNGVFFSRRENGKYFLIGADQGVPFVAVTYQGGGVRTPNGAAVAAGGWHHLAVVATGETITLYLDGEAYSSARAALPALNGPAVVGGDGVGGLMSIGGGNFVGELDELAIARVDRPPGFIKLAAVSQGPDGAKFAAFGEDEQRKSWLSAFKTGYVGVIIGSLSVDGWVVIGILAVMGAVSWLVMIRKALYLNRVVRGNVQFLSEWRHVANDLSVLDSADAEHAKTMGGRVEGAAHRAMHEAPLFRVYHIGVEEIQFRLAADQSGVSRVLSGQSIQAIRASLDGGLVRETQKLNAQMVLLTIAISGGPFLGLLGTVVGVMITFAAVAAAGDVNVNAIAPGIAAALAATVAGLAVAIPALFGYNYLLTRIKSVTSDMHVFIDEFVSKLAEFYSEPVA
jgi:biopolymer transport protein ExbB